MTSTLTGQDVTATDASGNRVVGTLHGTDGYAEALIIRADGSAVRVALDSLSARCASKFGANLRCELSEAHAGQHAASWREQHAHKGA